MAENAKALEKHGVNQHRDVGHYNYNVLGGEGTNATYLTARIARDRPDILADMKAGKYRSVRAAAIAGKTRLLHVLTSGPDGCILCSV